MAINKFYPTSPDLNITTDSDMTVAKFGHLNKLVEDINAGCGGGGGSTGLIVEGEGLNSSIRCGVNNQAFGVGGMAIGGENNITCNNYTASLFGRGNSASGCYSSVSGMANVVTTRNSHILSGSNNIIACDAIPNWTTDGYFTYAGTYYCAIFNQAPWPTPQILAVCIDSSDLTSVWNTGDTMSGMYAYASGNPTVGGCSSRIQFINAEVLCAAYEDYCGLGCGTYLYTCFDPNTPAWCGFIPNNTDNLSNTYSEGYIQKTGSFSTYGNTYSAYKNNTIVGGTFNTINGWSSSSTISGGYQNTVSNSYGAIFGGRYNILSYSPNSIIAGGSNSCIFGSSESFIGGSGVTLCNSSFSSGLTGVQNCVVNSIHAFIGSGRFNKITFAGCSSIISGGSNCISNTNIRWNNSNIFSGFNGYISNSDTSIINAGAYNCITSIDGEHTQHINTIINGCQSSISCSRNSGIWGSENIISSINCSFIVGSCITANRPCATFVNNLSIMNIPTSSAGLPSGAVWSDSGTLKIVP